MALSDIAPWFLGNTGFNERLELLTSDMVCAELGPNLERGESLIGLNHAWGHLLLSAIVLSASPQGNCQAAALRIAQGCLSLGASEQSEMRLLILDNLANQPAISLAVARGLLLPDFQKRLPMPAPDRVDSSLDRKLDCARQQFLSVGESVSKTFLGIVAAHDWISVSVPTSAGKFYIMSRWIADYIRHQPKATLIYLVPTSTHR